MKGAPKIPPGHLSPADWLVVFVLFVIAAGLMAIIVEAGL